VTETVIFAFLFAWFKGYKLKYVLKHWSIYPILLTCITHIYIVSLMFKGEYWFLEYAKYIKVTSLLFYFILIYKYKLLDISIFKNINLKRNSQIAIWLTSPVIIGAICTALGSKLNQIAVLYNNNKMPVFISNSWATGYAKADMFSKSLKYGDYHVMGDMYTKLIPLTDIFDAGYMSFSIGDALVRSFAFIIIYYSIKSSNIMKITTKYK